MDLDAVDQDLPGHHVLAAALAAGHGLPSRTRSSLRAPRASASPGRSRFAQRGQIRVALLALAKLAPQARQATLRHVGWAAYRVESYVNWCGHGQEVIPFPRPDGLVELVPVLGEAT